MSVALNDVLLWRRMLGEVRDVGDHRAVLKCLEKFQWQRKGSHAFVVNVLAQALYKLFSASDGKGTMGCVQYVSNICVTYV